MKRKEKEKNAKGGYVNEQSWQISVQKQDIETVEKKKIG